MGTFEALVELLDVHPQLPGEAPLTIKGMPSGWRVFTMTEAAASLSLIVGSGGRDPMHVALHAG